MRARFRHRLLAKAGEWGQFDYFRSGASTGRSPGLFVVGVVHFISPQAPLEPFTPRRACEIAATTATARLDTAQSAAAWKLPERLMHLLATLDEPGRGYAGGVQFTMIGGAIRVPCWVSAEALDRIAGGNPLRSASMAIFNRHRLRIEQLAGQNSRPVTTLQWC